MCRGPSSANDPTDAILGFGPRMDDEDDDVPNYPHGLPSIFERIGISPGYGKDPDPRKTPIVF